MTHHAIRELPDGTRVYSNGTRYTPVAPEGRKNAVRRPADPRALRYRGDWFLPLELLEDAQRAMPATRADEEAYDHMPRPCACEVCQRPPEQIGRWQRRWRRDHGLQA